MRALGLDTGAAIGYGVVDVGALDSAVAWGVLDPANPGAHMLVLLRLYGPGVVGVETIERVHPVERAGKIGISTTQALSLYQAGLLAGQLLEVARAAGVRVTRPTAERWRRAIIGGEHPSDAQIDSVLRLRLQGFPAPRKSCNHARDGLGVALYVGLEARMASR